MVASQIHPLGVIDERVLHAFRTVPREFFMPDHLRSVAYVDEDIILEDGRVMMEPVIIARMIASVGVEADDVVLNIGDSTGYSSAILSMLATTVITVETRPGQLDAARQVWAECSYCNVAALPGDLSEGCPEHAPYDVIFLNGSVAEVPQIFLAQLCVGGRLIAVLRPQGAKMGTITLIERVGDGKYASRALFDAATPYIPGFEPQPDFIF
jgi:protein-L-isoaspartate(D-aspartate) O-methyltransferase